LEIFFFSAFRTLFSGNMGGCEKSWFLDADLVMDKPLLQMLEVAIIGRLVVK